MAFCTNCGNQMADGVKFCTACGTAVAAAAPAAPPVITETAPTPAAASASTLTAATEPAAPATEQQTAAQPMQTAAPPVQQPVQQAPAPQPQPVYAQPAPQPAMQQQPAAQQPLYAPQPVAPAAAVYQEEPITTGSYIGIFLLLMIPIVNLICLLVWACGGCARRNKTNLARALLVWMLIGAVLGGIVLLVGSLLFGDTLDSIREIGSQINAATGE